MHNSITLPHQPGNNIATPTPQKGPLQTTAANPLHTANVLAMGEDMIENSCSWAERHSSYWAVSDAGKQYTPPPPRPAPSGTRPLMLWRLMQILLQGSPAFSMNLHFTTNAHA